MDDKNSKTEDIIKLFNYYLMQNNKLNDKEKDTICTSFTKNFLINYAKYLDEETIIKMCTSAKTVDIKMMNEILEEIAWWVGSYNPFTNRFSVSYLSDQLVSHEKTHAILKNNMFETGLGFFGYGLNEGLTAFCNNDLIYGDNQIIVNYLMFIVGFDKMIDIFLNKDLNCLIEELSKYTSKENVLKLISLTTINTFADYKMDFIYNLTKAEDIQLSNLEKIYNRNKKIYGIIDEMFKNKYKEDVKNNNLGKFIVNSAGYTEELFNLGDFYYTLNFNEKGFIDINVVGVKSIDVYGNKISNEIRYTCSLEQLKNISFEKWCTIVQAKLIENENKYKDYNIKLFLDNSKKTREDFNYEMKFGYEEIIIEVYISEDIFNEKTFTYTLEEFKDLDFDEWCIMVNDSFSNSKILVKD